MIHTFGSALFCSDTHFGQGNRCSFVCFGIGFGDETAVCHLVDYQITTVQCVFRETNWRPFGWVLNQPGQHCCFRHVQFTGVFGEIVLACRFNPVCTAVKIRTVQIMGDNFIFAQLFFNLQCKYRFFDFTSQRFFVTVQIYKPRELLGDGAAALYHFAGFDIGHHSTADTNRVNTAVFAEPLVFDGNQCIDCIW